MKAHFAIPRRLSLSPGTPNPRRVSHPKDFWQAAVRWFRTGA
jgi:hypothetical protein